MQDTDLFQFGLGLASPWMVTRSGFDAVDGRLDLYVDFPRGSRFACAQCGREGCAVHDTKEDTWRHLDFFQHRTLLHARTPRVTCPQCGVRKVATPWARAGSGFTLLLRPMCWRWPRRCRSPMWPAARRARHALVAHRRTLRLAGGGEAGFVAGAAHRRRQDSARRGHDYISLFVDMARRKVVYVADGKDAATVKEFADPRGAWRPARSGDRRQHRHGGCIRGGIKRTPTPITSTNFTSSNSPTRR